MTRAVEFLMGKIRILLTASLLATAFFAPQTQAGSKKCDGDSIKTISSNGDILIALSGKVYEVDAADQVDSSLWLALDDVLICNDGTIINTDEDGETVSVNRLK